MHKLHSSEIRWNLCSLQPTNKSTMAQWRSSQQCFKESFFTCVSAASFPAATSWTTPFPSASWTSSFTPTTAAHGLECSKSLIDKIRLFAEHSIFIEYWFTVKDIRICCWSAKKEKEESKKKEKEKCVNFSVWIYLYHVCWVSIQWIDSELWGIETNQNGHLDTVSAFVSIHLKIYLCMTFFWLGVSDHSLVTVARRHASAVLIAATCKLAKHSSLRNLLSFPQQYCIQMLIWNNNCKVNFLTFILQVEFPWKSLKRL